MGANLSISEADTDVVIGIKDLDVVEQMQQNHGGWHSGMNECLTGPCKIILEIGQDVLVKTPSGNFYLLNAELLVKYNAAEEYKAGTIVEIIKNEELFKQLQNSHGRWTETIKDILGKKVEIIQKFDNGDCKVKYNDKYYTINSKSIVNENDDTTKLIEKNCEKLKKGDIVQISTDIKKSKELQQFHGGWIPVMELLAGTYGIVKSILLTGDVKVNINGMKVVYNPKLLIKTDGQALKLNPECQGKTNSNSDSKPDITSDKSEKKIPKQLNDQTMNFYLALKIGNLTQVCKLIDLVGANTSINKMYPLLIATYEGHEDIVKFLIDKQAKINAMDDDGDTALHIAVLKNRFNICRLLVNVGADVNAHNNKKLTPIMIAAILGSQDILQLLVSSNNADLSIGDSDSDTSLHLAVQNSRGNSVEILLNAGADIKVLNKHEFNAFHIAVLLGNKKILEMILKKGGASIVNLQGKDSLAAIHLVVSKNHPDCLRILINYNADVNIRNKNLQTALHAAVIEKSLECVKILVENKADLNLQDGNGDTPLHDGMIIQNIERVKKMYSHLGIGEMLKFLQIRPTESNNLEDIMLYLVENGAKLDIKNIFGMTPLDFCEDDLKAKLLSTQASRN